MGKTALAGKWWLNRANSLLVRCPGHATHVSCHTHEWVMPHVRMSHVPCMRKACLAYDASYHARQWVTSYVWMVHFTHEWVISHLSLSHATHVSSHNYEWVMPPHVGMRHVRCMNKACMNKACLAHDASCHTQQWIMSAVSHMYTDIHMCSYHACHTHILQHTHISQVAYCCETLEIEHHSRPLTLVETILGIHPLAIHLTALPLSRFQ